MPGNCVAGKKQVALLLLQQLGIIYFCGGPNTAISRPKCVDTACQSLSLCATHLQQMALRFAHIEKAKEFQQCELNFDALWQTNKFPDYR